MPNQYPAVTLCKNTCLILHDSFQGLSKQIQLVTMFNNTYGWALAKMQQWFLFFSSVVLIELFTKFLNNSFKNLKWNRRPYEVISSFIGDVQGWASVFLPESGDSGFTLQRVFWKLGNLCKVPVPVPEYSIWSVNWKNYHKWDESCTRWLKGLSDISILGY